jgi:coenzyme PQQ precursor peptide PqqA
VRPRRNSHFSLERNHLMRWTKPEFEVVEVTMEVTAYVARR